jgi:hypothetical protein
MKKILCAVAMLASSLVPAHAEHKFSVKTTHVDSMPETYTGNWCLVSIETMRDERWEEYKKGKECPQHDYIAFCRNSSSICDSRRYDYELQDGEQACKFISVKKVTTHRVERPTVITYHTVARCYGEGDVSDNNTWIEKREFGVEGDSMLSRILK